jgi:O-antigen ligase
MFHQGKGSFGDLRFNYYESETMNIDGRSTWYQALKPGIDEYPVFGNGPRADNAVLSPLAMARGGEAHNDYLSVMYNYGYIGLGLLLGGFVLMFLKLRTLLKTEQNDYRYILITSTMTLFIGFAMFMYTDNILKYTIYFPNYFFAMCGMVFAEHRNGDE